MLSNDIKRLLSLSWAAQAKGLGLSPKSKKYADARLCFIKGSLVILEHNGQLSREASNIIHFLVACDRLDDVLSVKE